MKAGLGTALLASTAGCTGGTGGGGGSGSDGDEEEEASFDGQIADVAVEMKVVPHNAAVNEIMPEITDGRMTADIRLFSDSRTALTSTSTGSVEAYAQIVGDALIAQEAGNEFNVVSTKSAGTDYVIAAREGLTLEDFTEPGNDLRMGLNALGGISHVMPVGVFRGEGLDYSNVNWVQVGFSSARVQALSSGKIDGGSLHKEQLTRLQNEGVEVVNLANTADYFGGFIEEAIFIPPELKDDPVTDEWVQAYVEANERGKERANNDFEWVFEWTQRLQAQPLNREDARETYEFLRDEINAWPAWEFEKEPYETVVGVYKDLDLLEEASLDDMWEPKYFNAAYDKVKG